jgi:hypothetical protein
MTDPGQRRRAAAPAWQRRRIATLDAPTLPIHEAGQRAGLPAWGELPDSRVPGWAYTDQALYREELERFFYRGHWCYVGLECEIPRPATSSPRSSASAASSSCATTPAPFGEGRFGASQLMTLARLPKRANITN